MTDCSSTGCVQAPRYWLRFEPLVDGERVIEVPCDAHGRVDIEALDSVQRNEYFYARLMRKLRVTEPVVVGPTD